MCIAAWIQLEAFPAPLGLFCVRSQGTVAWVAFVRKPLAVIWQTSTSRATEPWLPAFSAVNGSFTKLMLGLSHGGVAKTAYKNISFKSSVVRASDLKARGSKLTTEYIMDSLQHISSNLVFLEQGNIF